MLEYNQKYIRYTLMLKRIIALQMIGVQLSGKNY